MKNVSNIGAGNSQAQVNLNSSTEEETVKNPLDCDVKTLRLYSIQKVSKMSRDYFGDPCNFWNKKCVSSVMHAALQD